jgi:hypothetical protein
MLALGKSFCYIDKALKKVLAAIAQSVEQRTENPRVGGSIPPRGILNDSKECLLPKGFAVFCKISLAILNLCFVQDWGNLGQNPHGVTSHLKLSQFGLLALLTFN